jgi:hypothetical protein
MATFWWEWMAILMSLAGEAVGLYLTNASAVYEQYKEFCDSVIYTIGYRSP